MDDSGVRRRRELAVDDEEGLLLLQEEFLKAQANAKPAARVTRITRTAEPSTPAAAAAAAATDGPSIAASVHGLPASLAASTGNAQDSDHAGSQGFRKQQQERRDAPTATAEQQPLCPSIPGILFEVKERQVGDAPAAPQQPSSAAAAPAAGTAAFPAAVHRKQSKFALGRRQQAAVATSSAAAALSPPPPAAAAAQGVAGQEANPSSSSSSSSIAGRSSTVATSTAGASNTSGGRTGETALAAAPAAAAAAAASARPEAAGIHEQNLAHVAGMSAQEVEEAQAELAGRFSPAALAFLKARANRKARQQQQQQTAQGSEQFQAGQQQHQQQHVSPAKPALAAAKPAAAAPSSGVRKGFFAAAATRNAAAVTAPAAPTTAGAAASGASAKNAVGIKKGFLGGQTTRSYPEKATTATAAAAAVEQGQQQALPAASGGMEPAAAAAAAAAAATAAPLEPLPPVARLRLSLDGQVLELGDPKTPPVADEEVLLRDNLSRAAGVVPQGYTLPEMRVLMRSSHAPQRAAGFRMLATVLRRAQPSVLHVGMDGQLLPRPVLLDEQQQQQQRLADGLHQQQQGLETGSLQKQEQARQSDDLQQQQQQQQQQQLDTGVQWSQVWDYASVVLRAVLLCRLGLDDDNAQVLAAAADAAAVLLGPSSSEALLEEVGSATAELSWPLSRRCSLRRLGGAAAWDRVEGLVRAAADAQQQQQQQQQQDVAGADKADSPEDLAAVDPLAGFMAAEPLPRIRFLLQHRCDTEAVIPLLSVLEAVAASSSTAAEEVVRCRGLPEALLALLDLPVSNTVTYTASQPAGVMHFQAAAATEEHRTAPGEQQQQQQQQRKRGSCRVAVLRLLRLLCSSSQLACQLLRTAGLDTIVQMLLCCSSDSAAKQTGSRSSSSTGASGRNSRNLGFESLESQLLLLEAMRIWMVSAAQGVSLAHMDVMFQFVAVLLQPPQTAAAGAAAEHSRSSTDDSAAVQWQLTAAAYQLVEVLLRHALAVNHGAKTLGAQMISPGCAAAIAQEAATHWLNPQVSRQIGQALTSLSDCQLPYTLDPNPPCRVQGSAGGAAAGFSNAEGASSQAAWLRVLRGLHPALLVPPAFALLSGFAAALAYLASYWESLQVVPKQLAAELMAQLQAAGLIGNSSSSGGGGSSSGQQHDAAAVPDLARVLLTATGSTAAAVSQQQQQLGRAVLQHCLDLLAAAEGGVPAAAAAFTSSSSPLSLSSSGSSSDMLLSGHALGAAAASTLLAVCQLQRQLMQLCQPKQQQQQQQELQQLGLAAAAVEVVSAHALSWTSTARQLLAFEPWWLAQQNLRQYQLKLLIRLGKPLLQALQYQQQQQEQQQEQQQQGDQQQQQQQLLWRVVDGLLCVLPLSGPGQEAQALQALQLLFWAEAVGCTAGGTAPVAAVQLMAAAGQAVQQLQQQGGPLAAAAAGLRADSLPTAAAGDDASAGYPYQPRVLSSSSGAAATAATGMNVADWCQVLLEGYAVAWLSVIAERDQQQQQQPQQQQGPGSDSSSTPSVLPLPRAYVAEVEGSRLPVPPEWLMAEILALPRSSSNTAIHPVSAALLLSLGLERSPTSCYMAGVRLPTKLEALLQLLYLFNAGELLAEGKQQQQQLLGPSWQQADARWAAALLSEQYCKGIVLQQQQHHMMAASAAAAAHGGGSSSSEPQPMPSPSHHWKVSCPVHKLLTSHQQQQQRPQLQGPTEPLDASRNRRQLLFPSWAASPAGSQTVDQLVRDLAELSMGDPLFACHVALLLLPAARLKLQRAVWGSMLDNGALHLLPPPGRCILGPQAYLGVLPGSQQQQQQQDQRGTTGFSSEGLPEYKFDVQLVGDMAKSLAQGDLKKALQMGGLSGQMALHGIAALCLDQNAWRDDGFGGSQAEGCGPQGTCPTAAAVAGESTAAPAKPVSAAGMAVNVLRGVVRGCPLSLLQQLVQTGVDRGLPVQEQGRALMQAAHGDASLMEKVRQLLASLQ